MNIIQVTGGPEWARWVADGEPIYIAVSKYEEKDAVKAAGFRWNPEKRSWWTNSIDAAANLAEYASGELGDKLKALRMAKVKSLAQSRAAKSDFDVPHPEGLAYRPFQIAGIEYMADRKNTLLTDDMGLGKTVQAIGFINANPEIRTVLIICPATLKGNWERELRRWLVRPMKIAIGDSTTCVMPEHGYDIVIQNYEAMRKHASVMASVRWDLLVCDEVHKCKNPKAQQTKAVQSIRAERILGMTGTPIVNRPVELYNLLVWLDKERWDKKWWWYVKRYCNATQTRYGLDVSGANKETLGELQNTLRETIMIRRLKADVLTELPPKQRQIIEIEPDGDAMIAVRQEGESAAQYEERMEEFRARVELAKAESEEGYREAVKQMQEAGSVMFGEMSRVRKATAIAKVPYVVDHLTELIESVGKVVCFVHHHEVAHAIANAFPLECMVLTGETKIEDRQPAVDRFQTDPNCKLAVVSIMAGGVGITLTAASYAVFAELDWVPGNVTQAEDRLHRIGQVDSVNIQHIVLAGSIDVNLAKTIVDKQEIIEKALDLVPEPVVAAKSAPATDGVTVQRVTEQAVLLSRDEIEAVHGCLKILASDDQDRASFKNGVGYNGCDSRIGHSLAKSFVLSAKQAVLGKKIVRKYRRQLPVELYEKIFGKEG